MPTATRLIRVPSFRLLRAGSNCAQPAKEVGAVRAERGGVARSVQDGVQAEHVPSEHEFAHEAVTPLPHTTVDDWHTTPEHESATEVGGLASGGPSGAFNSTAAATSRIPAAAIPYSSLVVLLPPLIPSPSSATDSLTGLGNGLATRCGASTRSERSRAHPRVFPCRQLRATAAHPSR